jgi:RNA recognition motif-containing protein
MNLFVAKLNPSTTIKDLQTLFSHYGLVNSIKIIADRNTGLSKCYGFVEMPNIHEANEALIELDDTLFQDNMISVKKSQPTLTRISATQTEYKNSTSTSPVMSHQSSNLVTSTSNFKPVRTISLRRNLGYRGSGFNDF